MQRISDLEKPLLLKNPWCYPYFLYIHKAIPNARFIFIHRNPVNVINSKLKLIDQVLSGWNAYTGLISKKYNKIFKNPIFRLMYRLMYFPHFNIGLNKVLQQAFDATLYFVSNINNLPEDTYISIQFEDLCEQPEVTLKEIFNFLQVTPIIPTDYQSLINKRPTTLIPAVAKNQKRITKRLAPYFKLQNYAG